jgi:hypothetical protein
MNYHEKRIIMTSAIGFGVTIAYIIFAISAYNLGTIESQSLKFWAIRMLIFIGIGVSAIIIGMILFHIIYSVLLAIKLKMEDKSLSDKDIEKQIKSIIKTDAIEDEMEKLIQLKSSQISFALIGIGFVLALLSLVFNYSGVIMINIIFVSFSFGSAIEGLLQLYYHKKGIHHV